MGSRYWKFSLLAEGPASPYWHKYSHSSGGSARSLTVKFYGRRTDCDAKLKLAKPSSHWSPYPSTTDFIFSPVQQRKIPRFFSIFPHNPPRTISAIGKWICFALQGTHASPDLHRSIQIPQSRFRSFWRVCMSQGPRSFWPLPIPAAVCKRPSGSCQVKSSSHIWLPQHCVPQSRQQTQTRPFFFFFVCVLYSNLNTLRGPIKTILLFNSRIKSPDMIRFKLLCHSITEIPQFLYYSPVWWHDIQAVSDPQLSRVSRPETWDLLEVGPCRCPCYAESSCTNQIKQNAMWLSSFRSWNDGKGYSNLDAYMVTLFIPGMEDGGEEQAQWLDGNYWLRSWPESLPMWKLNSLRRDVQDLFLADIRSLEFGSYPAKLRALVKYEGVRRLN